MEKKKVKFVRYISSEGMSLRWKEWCYDYREKKIMEGVKWAEKVAFVDVNALIGEVEEIPYSQYKEETKSCCIDWGGIR